jgi:hypothetical protein
VRYKFDSCGSETPNGMARTASLKGILNAECSISTLGIPRVKIMFNATPATVFTPINVKNVFMFLVKAFLKLSGAISGLEKRKAGKF